MKTVILVLFFLIYTGNLCCDEPSSYLNWLDRFADTLDSTGIGIDSQERMELDHLIAMKPSGNTGRHYGKWFNDLFVPCVESVGLVLDDSEEDRLEYVLKARSALMHSGDYFRKYLKFAEEKIIDEFLPVLNTGERKLSNYIVRGCPEKDSKTNYNLWLSMVEKIKSEMGVNISSSEKRVLDFMMMLKPDPSDDPLSRTMLKIEAETLFKIRSFILNNKPYRAVEEIDSFLRSSEK